MYLARQLTKMSYPQIGRRLGGRDHTTILHGNRKITKMLRETNTMAYEVEGVREILQQLEPSKERDRFFASRPLVETRI
jgi:chromosomal replication initiator protein